MEAGDGSDGRVSRALEVEDGKRREEGYQVMEAIVIFSRWLYEP